MPHYNHIPPMQSNQPKHVLAMPSMVQDIVDSLHHAGATCYVVGGFVRDLEVQMPSKDIDIEIHNLDALQVEGILGRYGEVDFVGKSFGVYLIRGLDVDWALPRTEVSTGNGHKTFDVTVDPHMGLEKALRRRDFTMNAMAISLKDGSRVDPFRGDIALHDRRLQHVDEDTFIEDPLRVLRGAQFCARFGLTPSRETTSLCNSMVDQYQSLPKERVWGELKKMLLTNGNRPSLGIHFLRHTGWLVHWPELSALFDTPQDKRWHPEGDVGTHTCEVIDNAAAMLDTVAEEDKLVYMLACLLHDVGKPATTKIDKETGHITSYGHDKEGCSLVQSFLRRLTNEEDIIQRVVTLVENHMFPHLGMKAKAPAYRRLQKKVDARLLGKVAEADNLGAEEANHYFNMLASVGKVEVVAQKETIVNGRHLIARGMTPGKAFGAIIQQCEEYFLETGNRNPEEILDHILGQRTEK